MVIAKMNGFDQNDTHTMIPYAYDPTCLKECTAKFKMLGSSGNDFSILGKVFNEMIKFQEPKYIKDVLKTLDIMGMKDGGFQKAIMREE